MSEALIERLDKRIDLMTTEAVKKAVGPGHNQQLSDPKFRDAMIEMLKIKKEQAELNRALNLLVREQKDRGYSAVATRATLKYLSMDPDTALQGLQELHTALVSASAQLPLFIDQVAVIEGRKAELDEIADVVSETTDAKQDSPKVAELKPQRRANPIAAAKNIKK